MKVAIITIIDKENIGNRLQNYAVQELLKEMELDVTTIDYYNTNNNDSLLERIKLNTYSILSKIGFFQTSFYIDIIKHNPRLRLVQEFNKKYVNITKDYLFSSKKKRRMEKHANDFDYYCVGSDQIWNSYLVQNNDFFFCCFAKSERCFSFAASMGTTFVQEKFIDTFKRGLKHLGNISVREIETQKYIKSLVDRDAVVLLDPTLLLTRDKWLDIVKKPDFVIPRKFIVTYFLSEQTKAQKELISAYAQKNGLKIIDINGLYKTFIGPSEFVYLISSAEYVFTDSFHGTAFSVIFNKPFIVFKRNNIYDMSARITTLLKKINLCDRFYAEDNNLINLEITERLTSYDADGYRKEEIRAAKNFLNLCLKRDD